MTWWGWRCIKNRWGTYFLFSKLNIFKIVILPFRFTILGRLYGVLVFFHAQLHMPVVSQSPCNQPSIPQHEFSVCRVVHIYCLDIAGSELLIACFFGRGVPWKFLHLFMRWPLSSLAKVLFSLVGIAQNVNVYIPCLWTQFFAVAVSFFVCGEFVYFTGSHRMHFFKFLCGTGTAFQKKKPAKGK